MTIIGWTGGKDNNVRLVAPAQAKTALATLLSEHGVEDMSSRTHEILQVETSIGSAKRELSEEYTPLEIGSSRFRCPKQGLVYRTRSARQTTEL